MKAIRINAWGNEDVINLDNINPPVLNDNEVLIAVHAAGVNPIDWKVREGYFSSFMQDSFPFAMGWDVSGVITEVGSKVSSYQKGDAVLGLLRFPQPAGTFAEYVSAPVDEITLKPQNIDYIQAAAAPLVSLTAWQGLFEYANLQPDQTVLIHAAGGSVGQCAVQLARWKGAKVIASASNPSKDLLLSYGIDQFIDYKTTDFVNALAGEKVDVVFDPLGGDNALKSVFVLKKNGKLISLLRTNQEEITEQAKKKNIDAFFMIVKPNGDQLKEIMTLIAKGLIQLPIEKVFTLEEVKKALNLVQTGHCHGKVVLSVHKLN